MKPRHWLILAVMFMIGTEPRDDSAKKELAKLEGTWVLAAIDKGDGKCPQDVTTDERFELTIHGNKAKCGQVEWHKKSEGYLRIDPSRQPKWLDWSFTDTFKPGETIYKLYELEGNTLKICVVTDGWKQENRPKEFKAADKTASTVSYWEKKP
ncbi:hypothetical protein BH10PLA2_BH10PLA2_38790 [soil metagenome]